MTWAPRTLDWRKLVGDANVDKVVFAAVDLPGNVAGDRRYEALRQKLVKEVQPGCNLIRLNNLDASIQQLLDLLADTGKRDHILQMQYEMSVDHKSWRKTAFAGALRMDQGKLERLFSAIRAWMNMVE